MTLMPRWLAIALIGLVLILAGVFLAPLAPAGVATFLYYALLLAGGVLLVWALIVAIMAVSR